MNNRDLLRLFKTYFMNTQIRDLIYEYLFAPFRDLFMNTRNLFMSFRDLLMNFET